MAERNPPARSSSESSATSSSGAAHAPTARGDASDSVRITDNQRNGSITGVGIVLGFSLTFAAQWSLGPGEWNYFSVLTLLVALPGIALQLVALFRILSLPLITVGEHRLLLKRFVQGVSLVLLGYLVNVVLGIAVDKHLINLP